MSDIDYGILAIPSDVGIMMFTLICEYVSIFLATIIVMLYKIRLRSYHYQEKQFSSLAYIYFIRTHTITHALT